MGCEDNGVAHLQKLSAEKEEDIVALGYQGAHPIVKGGI
jgi:hypothetical protein